MKTNSSPPFLGHVEHVGAVIPRQEQSEKSMSCMLIHGRRGKVVLCPVIRTAPRPDDYYENNRVLTRQLECFEVVWRFENFSVRRSRHLRISTFENLHIRRLKGLNISAFENFNARTCKKWGVLRFRRSEMNKFWYLRILAFEHWGAQQICQNAFSKILKKFVNLSIRRFKSRKMHNKKIRKFGKPNVPKFIISFRKLKLLNKLLSREYRTSIRQSKLS